MALPRPLLLALLGAVLVGVAFVATRGSEESSDENSSAEVAPAPDADVPPLKQSTPKPTTDVRKALAGAKPVTSGTFELRLSAEKLDVTANGSFQSRGLAKLPLFRIDVAAKNAGKTLQVGGVSSGDKGYLLSGDKALEIQPDGWMALARARAEGAKRGPSRDDFHGLTARELDSMKLVGQDNLDGVPVLHFRGIVDLKEARRDLGNMAEVFEMTSLDSPLPGLLARSIQGGTGEIWVGAEDHLVRRTRITLRSPKTPFEFDLKRANLGEPQTIPAPRNASTKTAAEAGWNRDEFGLAFSSLVAGIFSVETPAERKRAQPDRKPARRERGQDRGERGQARGERRQARPDRRPARRAGASPAAVRRAVRQRQVVVLFFRQAGADDDAVASAVNAQRGRRGVAVFTLPVGQAPKYEQYGGALVVRAPAIVIVGRDRAPRLYEGFIDSATLAQAVTDAR